MPTIVDILTFIRLINTTSERLKAREFFICQYFSFYEQLKFCSVEFSTKTVSVAVGFLFIVTPIVGDCNCSMFCCTILYVHSSIGIILMGKRELVALLNLSSWCLVMVEWLFLVVPWGCLRFVIVVFPDHTYLLFITSRQVIFNYASLLALNFCNRVLMK